MPPDEPNEEEELEKLPEDGETPFRPAPGSRDDTYPTTDADLDQTEIYQEGIHIEEPNAGNAVKGYDAAKDHRL